MSQEFRTAAIGEKSDKADAHETAWQCVQQESPQELFRSQGHEPFLISMCVVLPAEHNPIISEADQPVIGDGHAVRVAGQILQDVLRSTEGRLGVDNPVVAK